MSSTGNRAPESNQSSQKAIETKNEGNKFFVQGKYEQALEFYSRAIEVCPKEDKDELSKIYHNRAASYEKLKNYRRVIEECTKALEMEPGYLKALARRAKAAAELEDFEMAIDDMTSVCVMEKYTNRDNIASSLSFIQEYSDNICVEKIKNFKQISVNKYMVGEYFIGYTKDPVYNNQLFFSQLEQEAMSQPSEMYNAVKEFNNENYDKSVAHCTNEIKNKGKYINEARNLRGSLYHLRLQYAEAIMDFNEITNSPTASNRVKANALAKMPQSLHHLDEYTKSKVVSIFNKAIELDPKNEDIYVARAGLLPQIDNLKNHNSDLDIAIRLNPDNKAAHINKAFFEYILFFHSIARRDGCMDENQSIHLPPKAKRLVEKEAQKLDPLLKKFSDIAEPFRQYANVLHEQRNYEQADKYYRMAIEREPKNGKLHAKLAWNHILWKEKDYETPYKILSEAVHVDNNCEEAFRRFAQLEMKNKNFAHAVELCNRIVDLTRYEPAKRDWCKMAVVAKTQIKMVDKFGTVAMHLNYSSC